MAVRGSERENVQRKRREKLNNFLLSIHSSGLLHNSVLLKGKGLEVEKKKIGKERERKKS